MAGAASLQGSALCMTGSAHSTHAGELTCKCPPCRHTNVKRKVVAAEREVARVNAMPDPMVREPALRCELARLTQLAVAEASP